MNTGRKIQDGRKKLKLTQEEFAEKCGVNRVTVSCWETGKYAPEGETLKKVASTLGVSIDYLIGSDDSNGLSEISNVRLGERFMEIPVLSIETAASCGAGNGLWGVEPENTDTVIVEADQFHQTDNQRRPFGIRTEGDSMEGAGITEGAIAVINPAEYITSGDAVLIVWDDKWFIKWILFAPDGSVELRSANPAYGPIKIEKEYVEDASWFRIIGKVTSVIRHEKPRRAF